MPYTVTQAAEMLGLHKTSIIARIRNGVLKARKVPMTAAFAWEIDDKSLMENLSIKARGKRI